MYSFCTYFDDRYLPRGLALHASLKQHCREFRLWVLCLNAECQARLEQLALPEIRPIALAELERGDPALLNAKANRSNLEYYFTCTPSLPRHILDRFPEVQWITYLDADLYFFADPAPVFEEIGAHSVAIIGHRFPEAFRHHECYGRYNVGWLSFRRDANALACLSWWRDRCLEWCYDRCEDGRFADQKYLDGWPEKFPGVLVLGHKGANLAPWNLANYSVRADDRQIWVDDQPLIFFHFHALKQLEPWLFDPNLATYGAKLDKPMLRRLYQPYFQALHDARARLPRSPATTPFSRGPRKPPSIARRGSLFKRLKQICRGLLGSDYLVVRKGRIL